MRVFYCAPYCSSQKPQVERFHLDLRRILQKGVSFNPLDQEQVNLIMSHLNSYPRPSLDGRTPYDMFVGEFGEDGLPGGDSDSYAGFGGLDSYSGAGPTCKILD